MSASWFRKTKKSSEYMGVAALEGRVAWDWLSRDRKSWVRAVTSWKRACIYWLERSAAGGAVGVAAGGGWAGSYWGGWG